MHRLVQDGDDRCSAQVLPPVTPSMKCTHSQYREQEDLSISSDRVSATETDSLQSPSTG